MNEMIIWGHVKDKREAAIKAFTAGFDMDMESIVYVQEPFSIGKRRCC